MAGGCSHRGSFSGGNMHANQRRDTMSNGTEPFEDWTPSSGWLKRQSDNVEKNMKENPMLQPTNMSFDQNGPGERWEDCVCFQDEHHKDCPTINKGTCHYQGNYQKPLAFDVKDEGCQAEGPALFGGTDSSARFRDSRYLEGLHDGYIEGMQKGLALLKDYINMNVQPMIIQAPVCTRAHVVEDAGDRKRREESKSERTPNCGDPTCKSMTNEGCKHSGEPVYIQGHNVDVRTCKHCYNSSFFGANMEECNKCGLRRFNPDKAGQ